MFFMSLVLGKQAFVNIIQIMFKIQSIGTDNSFCVMRNRLHYLESF